MTEEPRCSRCGGPLDAGPDDACPWCARTTAPVPTAEAPPPASWKRLGKYFLAEKLGTGGMGEVWKALDGELGRPVALKFLKTTDEAELARFRREAQTAASLSHPNIASIFEVGQAEGRPFLAMQYVRGSTLGRFPRDDRKLLLRLIRDAARAVGYANRQGIIHRDLKPDNMMVADGPEGPQVFVLDFGLARPIAEGQTVSLSGTVLGTPAYMSPEQTRGEKLDERTDVYSLGATLYELLTGVPPFQGANAYEIAGKVLGVDPVPPRRRNPKVHQDLETIALKCLEKDRARRFPTADALADEIDRFLEGEPILARPAGTLTRLARGMAKHRIAVAAAVLLAALLAVGSLFLVERSRTAAHQAALRQGRDAWEEVVKAVAAQQGDRARGLALIALGHFDRASGASESAEAQVLRGRCLQLLGRDGEAREAWRRALVLDPAHPEGRYQSAKLLLLAYQKSRGVPDALPFTPSSDPDGPPQVLSEPKPESEGEIALRLEAEALLGGVTGAPERGEFLRGLLALGRGRFAEAAELVGHYTEVEPWDFPALLLRAIACHYAGQAEAASAALDRVLAATPAAEAYLWRAAVRLRLREYEGAFADCTRALQLDPSLAAAHRHRARAHRSRGEVDAALADLARAVELDPDSPLAYLERAFLRLNYRGDYQGAREDAKRAVELVPEAGFALQSLAAALAALGDLAGAADAAARALELDPRRDTALTLLVACRIELGDLDGAERAAVSPTTAEGWRARAAVRDARGDARGAREALDRALELDPASHRALLDRARLRRDSGDASGAAEDFDGALRAVDKSFERRPRDPRGFLRRALVRDAMGDLAGAVEDCTRALDLDPRHGPAFAARAAARLAAGDFDGAIADTRQTLFPMPRVRGLARLGKGDVDGARADLEHAVESSPSAKADRALVHYARGDFPAALADLQAAPAKARSEILVWALKSRLGQREEADRELKSAPLSASERVAAAEALGPGGEAVPSGSAAYASGIRHLLGGDAAGARRLFRRALDSAPRRDAPELLAAAAETRRRD